jgi:dTDP-4-amino-4,6-dideoxygalactose transaminase
MSETRSREAQMLLPADPKRCYLSHKEEIDAAVRRVLEGGSYILGEQVAAFEREFAHYLRVPHAIGVGSGTEALHLALRTIGAGAGDKVITVSHTAVATVAAIELAGATPVLLDIDPETFTIDVSYLERAVEMHQDVKAIIPVHLYGHPADMRAIMDIADRHGVFVIEDCAQSHGAATQGRKTGSWGHMAAFSFYPTKNLGALGDGGVLATREPALAERAQLLRQYGWKTRYISELAGMNSRLDEIQAAILRVKLRYLDTENERRRQIAAIYSKAFSTCNLAIPRVAAGASHVYHQYTIRSPLRDKIQACLKDEGILTAILYPQPVHLQPAYRGRLVHRPGEMDHTEAACREILCLPIHPQLSEDEVARVVEAVVKAT